MFGEEVERIRTRYGRFYVPKRDSVIGRSLRLYGEWAEHEITTVSGFLKDGPTIVDVGANIGCHSAAFSARFPSSRVIAVEPNRLAYALLAANMVSNGYAAVFPENVACGRAGGVMNLSVDYAPAQDAEWNLGANSLAAVDIDAEIRSGDSRPTLVRTLDDILHGETVQFIKIDVEGMEDQVLAGAQTTLKRDRPSIFFEVLELSTLWSCRVLLLGHGYKLYWLETSAYNRDNFRESKNNIWSCCEMGVLAVPEAVAERVDLPEVTGEEIAVPFVRNPGDGWSVTETIPGETARASS